MEEFVGDGDDDVLNEPILGEPEFVGDAQSIDDNHCARRSFSEMFLCLVVCSADATALWATTRAPAGVLVDVDPEAEQRVVGAFLARWELLTLSESDLVVPDNCPLSYTVMEPTRFVHHQRKLLGKLIFQGFDKVQLALPHRPTPAGIVASDLLKQVKALATKPGQFATVGALHTHALDRGSKRVVTIEFAPWVVSYIFNLGLGAPFCFYAACVSHRFCRNALRVGPSKKQLRKFRVHDSVQGVSRSLPTHLAPQLRPVRYNQHVQAAIIIEWVAASRFISDINMAQASAKAHAAIFARGSTETKEQMMARITCITKSTITKARVKVDCLAMLMYQVLFRSMIDSVDSFNIHLFCDGSPQWRGVELYASSMDLMFESMCRRSLLPVVGLPRYALDVVGKTVALLWQLMLVVGVDMLQMVCRRVRSLTTDNGVERLIQALPDFLHDFFVYCRIKPPRGLQQESLLFPRAIRIPGWRHKFDLIIRKGLVGMLSFPAWLKKLKSLVRLMRDHSLLEVLVTGLEAQGAHGLSALLTDAKCPSFAKWRWCTLHACCQSMKGFIRSLAQHFDPVWFAAIRDQEIVRDVLAALRSEHWLSLLDFITWYSQWLTDILEWVGGCDCHPDDGAASCNYKGRRLAHAYTYASHALREGLGQANDWRIGAFRMSQHSLTEAIGCVRVSFAFGVTALDYLDRVPVLLCRLGQPGVRHRVLQQFDAVPRCHHDAVTLEFLDRSDSSMRADVLLVGDDGSGLSPRLAKEVSDGMMMMNSTDEFLDESSIRCCFHL